jgi:hypothetical protein
MADDVVLGSKISDLNDTGVAQLRERLEAARLIVKRIDRNPLTVIVSVPGATSNDEAATEALRAAETFASGPGAGWIVSGFVGFAQGDGV